MPAWLLTTPSSRGIGLALTRHLLRTTSSSLPVVATARTDLEGTREKILAGLPDNVKGGERLDIQRLDFEDECTIQEVAAYCGDRYNDREKDKNAHLRLAFLIPGMLHPERSPSTIDHDLALQMLKTNLLAPMLLMKHFTQFLPKKATILDDFEGVNKSAIMAFMSARVGSITDNERGGWYNYRSSKAGVNQMVKSLDIYLKAQSRGKAVAVGLHPGTVKTDLSKEFWASTPDERLFEPEFSAEKLVRVVRDLDVEGGRGRCWDWKGEEVPP